MTITNLIACSRHLPAVLRDLEARAATGLGAGTLARLRRLRAGLVAWDCYAGYGHDLRRVDLLLHRAPE